MEGRRTVLLYIAGRQARKSASVLPRTTAERARIVLGRIKRDQRFELWLGQRMRERTTIHLPRFKDVLSPGQGS